MFKFKNHNPEEIEYGNIKYSDYYIEPRVQ
jgi:hypothetical protein